MKYDKLIRDRIPEIIEKAGKPYRMRTASPEEYERYLIRKVSEEAAELAANPSLEELADILEVIFAIADARGSSREELEKLRQKKAEERGGFKKRLILLESGD